MEVPDVGKLYFGFTNISIGRLPVSLFQLAININRKNINRKIDLATETKQH